MYCTLLRHCRGLGVALALLLVPRLLHRLAVLNTSMSYGCVHITYVHCRLNTQPTSSDPYSAHPLARYLHPTSACLFSTSRSALHVAAAQGLCRPQPNRLHRPQVPPHRRVWPGVCRQSAHSRPSKVQSSGRNEGRAKHVLLYHTWLTAALLLCLPAVQPVGRLAAQLAKVLQGKDKPTYDPSRDLGDICIVINAEKAVLTGRKWDRKTYTWHTGKCAAAAAAAK